MRDHANFVAPRAEANQFSMLKKQVPNRLEDEISSPALSFTKKVAAVRE